MVTKSAKPSIPLHEGAPENCFFERNKSDGNYCAVSIVHALNHYPPRQLVMDFDPKQGPLRLHRELRVSNKVNLCVCGVEKRTSVDIELRGGELSHASYPKQTDID